MDATYKCHDYISPVTAISIQTDLQFTQNASHMVPWAFDYIIKLYHQHSIHMLSHNSPWIPHASIMAYTSPVIVISIQIDHQFTRNISHMVSMELDYIINHHCQYSIHMLSPNPPQIPHASIMFHIPPIFAISIQIDLQFTRNVSPMVSGALDYTIDLSHQYSIHLLSHNWPWIPHASIITAFHP